MVENLKQFNKDKCSDKCKLSYNYGNVSSLETIINKNNKALQLFIPSSNKVSIGNTHGYDVKNVYLYPGSIFSSGLGNKNTKVVMEMAIIHEKMDLGVLKKLVIFVPFIIGNTTRHNQISTIITKKSTTGYRENIQISGFTLNDIIPTTSYYFMNNNDNNCDYIYFITQDTHTVSKKDLDIFKTTLNYNKNKKSIMNNMDKEYCNFSKQNPIIKFNEDGTMNGPLQGSLLPTTHGSGDITFVKNENNNGLKTFEYIMTSGLIVLVVFFILFFGNKSENANFAITLNENIEFDILLKVILLVILIAVLSLGYIQYSEK